MVDEIHSDKSYAQTWGVVCHELSNRQAAVERSLWVLSGPKTPLVLRAADE